MVVLDHINMASNDMRKTIADFPIKKQQPNNSNIRMASGTTSPWAIHLANLKNSN